jgi:ethanolamine utilization protein EutA
MDTDVVHRVNLLGLDIGSTTSSALIAAARIGRDPISGRIDLIDADVVYRGEPVFTPFRGDRVDEPALGLLIDTWLAEAGVTPERLFAGGAIVTGLAARQSNAVALAKLVRERCGEAVMATAEDPRLESWLAFMGGCSTLSRWHKDTALINLDIGGGTTNAALGRDGNVEDTGCHFIGARHLQFEPGSYRLTCISEFGAAMLAALGIEREVGDTLGSAECVAVVGYCVAALEAIAAGDSGFFGDAIGQRLEQVPFRHSAGDDAALTFSGGVGELVYRAAAGEALPGTTHYGDLGIDLARAIVASPQLARSLQTLVPEQRGRATVYGVTLHSTQVSGVTLHLPQPEVLPLRDLPVMARLGIDAGRETLERALRLASTAPKGACVQLLDAVPGQRLDAAAVRGLGQRIAAALRGTGFPPHLPLVLLLEQNAAKALGQYASDWGRVAATLVVIDEVPVRGAQFVNLGRLQQQVVPISYYGLHQPSVIDAAAIPGDIPPPSR